MTWVLDLFPWGSIESQLYRKRVQKKCFEFLFDHPEILDMYNKIKYDFDLRCAHLAKPKVIVAKECFLCL